MTNDAVIAAALHALAGNRHRRIEAEGLVAKSPGLYAFYGYEHAWSDLGLTPAFRDQSLYVGKAEKSLNGRDVGTHFATGKTGSSTVRRSLVALLADRLDVVAVPRNLGKPDGSANFGLDPTSDARLSDWMERRLSLATWGQHRPSCPRRCRDRSGASTTAPLNLDRVDESRERLRQARKRLADIARAWQPAAGPTSIG